MDRTFEAERSEAGKRVGRTVGWAFLSIVLAGVAGCASPPPPNWSTDDHSTPPASMVLSPGDQLDIRFFGAAELNVLQEIRRDGRITLELLGDLKVAGYSPNQVQMALKKAYEDQLQIKEISVVISSPAPVFVSGAVVTPGPVRLGRPTTALEAVMQAGGFNEAFAETRSVLILRQVDGKYDGLIVNLEGVLEGELRDPFYLQPFDVVYVPRTLISRMNQWIDQYINRMIPGIPVGISSEGEITAYF